MPDDNTSGRFQAAWQAQPEEKLAVDVQKLIKRRTGELYSRTRVDILLSICAALCLPLMMLARYPALVGLPQQIGFAAVGAWIAVSVYRFRDRIWRSSPEPVDAVAASSVQFYRKELERRRDHLRNAWIWHGPLFLACTVFVATIVGTVFPNVQRMRNALPFVVLLVIWTSINFVMRRRVANAIQAEIDELQVS
jgi:hypothetical protein